MLKIQMKLITISKLLLITGILFSACNGPKQEIKEYNKGIHIVPLPSEIAKNEGVFNLNTDTKIITRGSNELDRIITQFNKRMEIAFGQSLSIITDTPSKNYI